MTEPGMPCNCPGCGIVVDLNDMRRDPLDPTGRELVCPPCAVKRQREIDEASTSPVVTFHAEPATTSRVDEYGSLEESMDRSASYMCAMRHDPEHEGALGWCERENVETSRIWMEWRPFYAVQLHGETEPQRFCEDDARWITVAAEYLSDHQEGEE